MPKAKRKYDDKDDFEFMKPKERKKITIATIDHENYEKGEGKEILSNDIDSIRSEISMADISLQSNNWQDNKTVIQCNEQMFNYAVTNDKGNLLYPPEMDMHFLVTNSKRVKAVFSVKTEPNNEELTKKASEESLVDLKLPKKFNSYLNTSNTATELRGHSYVLCSRSGYFAEHVATGEQRHRSKQNIDQSSIEFRDIEPEAFKQVLRYLYTDVYEPNPDLVMFTMYAARQLKVPYLFDKCVKFVEELLTEDVDPEHVMMIMDHSEFFNMSAILNKCRRWFVRHTKEAINSKRFSQISHQTLAFILKANHFKCTELELFFACKKWAETQCIQHSIEPSGDNIRRMLNDFDPEGQVKMIYEIHFPAIPLRDYVEHVSTAKILLPKEEEVQILRFLGQKPNSSHCIDVRPFKTHERYYEVIGSQEISKVMKDGCASVIGYDEQYLMKYDVMNPESNRVLELTFRVTSEITVILQQVTIQNQFEFEGDEGGNSYVSQIEFGMVNSLQKPQKIQVQQDQQKQGQAVLQLGSHLRLEARQTYEVMLRYTFNVKNSSSVISFLDDKEQHFEDDFNLISFYNDQKKMMPFLAIKYQAY